ncbi:TolC family protein [Vibrio panuliri]|uniref:Copper transporter n=1 Tax=Vibrio panuliri TaxID=1381081 RepID=A0ABX3F864_9VIBR|nr:TolC family protein [Vibrio panuliri]OLQ85248.1 copper transporter [Vibrio panuliri]
MKTKYHQIALSLVLALSAVSSVNARGIEPPPAMTTQSPTSLEQIIAIALSNDASRAQLIAQSNATLSSGQAKATLMDPTIKLGVGGMPVDSFRLDQDPMSNISLGVMQKFDRGDTIELQQTQAEQQAEVVLQQADSRAQDITTTVTALWLELGYNQKVNALLNKQKQWLEQLIASLDSNYSLGLSESQDVISAQLKLSQLEQKLVSNQQMQAKISAQLSEWLGSNWLEQTNQILASNQLHWDNLESLLTQAKDAQARYQLLLKHPTIKAIDSSLASAETQVSIAEEAYAPQFGVEVMYAHRQANNMRGEPAPDMVSAYLTMDIPLFTGSKQDKALEAAQYQVGAAKSQRDAWLYRMEAQLSALLSDRQHIQQRITLYTNHLLKQARAQRDAIERGYQTNRAGFSDIVTSSITEISLELERERLITDLNLTNNQIASLVGIYQSADYSLSRR